jgi:putative hemolysin
MFTVIPRDRSVDIALRCAAGNRTAACDRRGAFQGWLEDVLCKKLVDRRQTGLLRLAQRALSFTELNDFVAAIRPDTRQRQLAALARALDVCFEFKGLEHLQAAADRPVILFGNHPTGGGNVFGMSLLLANHFSEYCILGNRHMKFIPSLSETMIPVDPFCSGAAINMEALLNLRRDFGVKYRALGVFPAGISSHLSFSRGVITDRDWSDAFMRMARHHEALLVPVWFSGRNRLRYYLAARIRKELGFLALPAEFLRLRGQTIEVVVGKPIAPDLLRHIPRRHAQMSFLRASTYELSREHRAEPTRKTAAADACGIKRPRPIGRISVGDEFEVRCVDALSARNAGPWAADPVLGAVQVSDALAQASYHVLLSRRQSPEPLAYLQVLDWRQCTQRELDQISPMRTNFQLPSDALAAGRHWMELVRVRTIKEPCLLTAARHVWMSLGKLAAAVGKQTEIVGLLPARDSNTTVASLQMELLQKSHCDDALVRARPRMQLLRALRHHEWRPCRDVAADGVSRRDRVKLVDPLLWHCAQMGVRFGAYGLRARASSQPCIVGRLGGETLLRLTRHSSRA